MSAHLGFQMQASSNDKHENVTSQKHPVNPATSGSPEPDEALIGRVLTRAALEFPPAEHPPTEPKPHDVTSDPLPRKSRCHGSYAPDGGNAAD